MKDIVHKWIVPALYTALWTLGLYVSQYINDIFPAFGSTQIEVFSFAVFFIIFFVELIVMMLDTYMTIEAYALSPRFILFTCVFMTLFVVFLYFIVSFFAATLENSDNVLKSTIIKILILSTLMKLLEMLVQNNPKWLLEKVQTAQINRGKRRYVNRDIIL